PFIARWPGKIAAGKIDQTSIFSAVDLLPTFCEIAGVKLPASYQPDGVSQVETLKGKGRSLRGKPLFWKTVAPWPARKAKPDHWVSYAVVHQNWKLVSNRDGDYEELYDLVTDPLEKNDLKGRHPAVIKELAKMLEQWQATLPAKPTGSVFSNLRSGKK
ncbi:MAG: N-acetylgalactosamine-6-sulfatase, partial [Planctomycetes bacterium]|nr:N-acetylgalactosamine-6-sulfatase [Planctomycetota bacterium]